MSAVDGLPAGVPNRAEAPGGRAGAATRGDAVGFVAIAALGAGCSLAATGFAFGTTNNLFHLPIVAALYDAPQFADDVFIQSLRHFAAGPWRLLDGADRYVGAYPLFLALAILSRFLAFAGFLACASLLGVRSRAQRCVFAAMLAATCLMRGVSAAGGGSLFVPDVTHSEIANGLMLLACYFAARGRLDVALATCGLTFFCNAFMGVWTLAPLLAIAAWRLRAGRLSGREALRQGAVGAVGFLAAAAPVVANVVGNPEFGTAPDVDYRTFLASYWPAHFLAGAISWTEALGLATLVALAALAFQALGRRATAFQVSLGGFCAVYAAGLVAPLVTASPAILNLHLLRASVALQMLAALGALALATRWMTGADFWRARVAGPALALSLCAAPQTIGFAPILLYLARLPEIRRATSVSPHAASGFRLVAAAIVTVALAFEMRAAASRNAAFAATVAEWTAVGAWAAAHTPPEAMFLTPVYDLRRPAGAEDPRAAYQWAGFASVVFEREARRRVWVDFKRGAAVMWTPSYHPIWRSRIDEALGLSSLPERRAYAARNGVDYVVDLCQTSADAPPTFRTRHLCVFPAADAAPDAAPSGSSRPPP